jgi:integrase
MISVPSLRDYARTYAVTHGLAPSSVKAHTYVLNSLARHLGREPSQADLDRDTVNAWLFAELSSGLDANTVHTRRRTLLTLWRDAFEEGWCETAPARIRKIKLPQKVPNAWTLEQIRQLLATADSLKGHLKRQPLVSRCLFWRAYTLTGYYTGLRLGDLLKLRFDQIGDDGTLVVIQNKTGSPVRCVIEDEGLSAIEGILRPARARVFGDVMSKKCIQESFAIVVKRAGLRGSTKWLRSSGASWCEANTPGSAMGFLGHKTHGLAYRHYVNPQIAQSNIARPPNLGGLDSR